MVAASPRKPIADVLFHESVFLPQKTFAKTMKEAQEAQINAEKGS